MELLPSSKSPGADRWKPAVLLACAVGAGWLSLLDKYVQGPREAYLWAVTGLLVALDVADWRDVRTLRRRFFLSLAAVAGALFLGELLRKLADRPDVSRRDALRDLVDFHGAPLWAATAWLYAPLLSRPRPRLRRWRDPDGPLFWIGTLLVLFAGWSFATAFASVRPDISFRYFGREIGVYAPLALCWIRWASENDRLRRSMKRAGVAMLAVGTAAGLAAGIVYMTGSPSVRAWLETPWVEFSDIVLREPNPDGSFSWRLSFPFGHHNRMAYFSVLAALGLGMAAATRRRPAGTAALVAWAVAVGAAVNLGLTLNRGAMASLGVAAAAAAVFWLGWRRGRWLLLLLPLAVPLLVVALPEKQEERLRSLTDPGAYTETTSTISMRFSHWQAAGFMIRSNPVPGIGYGWRNFEEYYKSTAARRLGYGRDHEAVHAHNVWLQTAAESGIPGAALWLLFTLARWKLLADAWRDRERLGPLRFRALVFWTALEMAIQFYSFGNLPLRRSLGVLTWGVWAVMAADLLAWRRDNRS